MQKTRVWINKRICILHARLILLRIDPLLGKDLETNKETTPLTCNGSTTRELLLETVLCNPLLGSCNSWITTMETSVLPMWSVPRSYLEDNWGDPVSCQCSVESEFSTEGCEENSYLKKCGFEEKMLYVIFEVIRWYCYSASVKTRCQETASGDCIRLRTLVCASDL
jgi:hypothetical protein